MKKIYTCFKRAHILPNQLEEIELIDITLIAGPDGTTVKVNRIAHPAWSALFEDALSQSNSMKIKLEDINGKVLNSLVDIMCKGYIEICNENIKDVLLAAAFFEMKTLTAFCFAFIEEHLLLDYNNCLDLFLFADEHGLLKLKHKSQTFAYHILDRVCTEEAFLLLTEQQLNNFFSDDDIQRAPRGKLFDSLMAWYRRDKVNRGDLMCGLLSKYVNFEFLEGRPVVLDWHSPGEKVMTQTQKIVYISDFLTELFVYIFHPELNAWYYHVLKHPKRGNRHRCANAVFNNKIIFSGGENRFGWSLAHVNCLDLGTMQFSPMCPMSAARSGHIMTEVNENLYIVGGKLCYGYFSRYHSSVETYNVRKGKWRKETSFYHKDPVDASGVLNGILYVGSTSNNWLDYYDPRVNKWARTASWEKVSPIINMAAVNDFLYVVGRGNSVGIWEALSNALLDETSVCIQRYDPRYDSWAVIESPKLAGNIIQ